VEDPLEDQPGEERLVEHHVGEERYGGTEVREIGKAT
jgi:hypothetical protein